MLEMSKIFEQQKFGPASAFLAAARDTMPIVHVDPGARAIKVLLRCARRRLRIARMPPSAPGSATPISGSWTA